MARKPTLFAITAFISLAIWGCIWDDEKVLPLATGKSGELVVVMDSSMWAGNPGLQVKKCFSAPQEGLPQSEPYFNVIQVVRPGFSQIFKTTRNIIVIEKKATDKATYVIKEDVWAKNQLVLLINANNENEAASIVQNSCS